MIKSKFIYFLNLTHLTQLLVVIVFKFEIPPHWFLVSSTVGVAGVAPSDIFQNSHPHS